LQQGGARGDVGLAPPGVFDSPHSQPSPAYPVSDDSASSHSDMPSNSILPRLKSCEALAEEGAWRTRSGDTMVAAAGSADGRSAAAPRRGQGSGRRYKNESTEHRAQRLAAARRRRKEKKSVVARADAMHRSSCERQRDLCEQVVTLKRTVQDLRGTVVRQLGQREGLYSDPPRSANEGGRAGGGGGAAAGDVSLPRDFAAANEESEEELEADPLLTDALHRERQRDLPEQAMPLGQTVQVLQGTAVPQLTPRGGLLPDPPGGAGAAAGDVNMPWDFAAAADDEEDFDFGV